MVEKSFDAIYKSAKKLTSRKHSIMLSRGAATGRFVPTSRAKDSVKGKAPRSR